MICEYCSIEFFVVYGSGRFCGQKCAKAFSTSKKRLEINEKVSKKLRNNRLLECCELSFKNLAGLKAHKRFKHTRTFESIKKDGTRKEWLIRERGRYCEVCQLSEWMGQKVPVELDHIDGNPENNLKENLRIICPNCHAQTSTYKGKNIGNVSNTKRQAKLKKYYGKYR